MPIKPMLAGKFTEDRLVLPVYVQPKFDGIRCLVDRGVGYSRTLKEIPNRFIQDYLHLNAELLEGFDGELIVGSPTAPDVYRVTMSGVMSRDGMPDFTFYVFDKHCVSAPFVDRYKTVEGALLDNGSVRLLPVTTLRANTIDEVYEHEATFLAAGYEGAILRSPMGFYQSGRRPSAVTGELLKLKRFLDDEATITGFDELLSNQNEPTISETGHTKRSSHIAGKVAMATLGALQVRNAAGQAFNVGTGFDQALRQKIWDNRDSYLGKTITYRYVKVGGYDVPRFPVFHGFRESGT